MCAKEITPKSSRTSDCINM